jgi:hypothetical protein
MDEQYGKNKSNRMHNMMIDFGRTCLCYSKSFRFDLSMKICGLYQRNRCNIVYFYDFLLNFKESQHKKIDSYTCKITIKSI